MNSWLPKSGASKRKDLSHRHRTSESRCESKVRISRHPAPESSFSASTIGCRLPRPACRDRAKSNAAQQLSSLEWPVIPLGPLTSRTTNSIPSVNDKERKPDPAFSHPSLRIPTLPIPTLPLHGAWHISLGPTTRARRSKHRLRSP